MDAEIIEREPPRDGVESNIALLSTIAAGVAALPQIAECLQRLADHFAPGWKALVGTDYIADRLGCTKKWVGDLAREGTIPPDCIAKGGDGGYWRFHRARIDAWIAVYLANARPRST